MTKKELDLLVQRVKDKNYYVVSCSKDLCLFFYDYCFVSDTLDKKDEKYRTLIALKTANIIEEVFPQLINDINVLYFLRELKQLFAKTKEEKIFVFFIALLIYVQSVCYFSRNKKEFPDKFVRGRRLLKFQKQNEKEVRECFKIEDHNFLCVEILRKLIFIKRNKQDISKNILDYLHSLQIEGFVKDLLEKNITVLLEE